MKSTLVPLLAVAIVLVAAAFIGFNVLSHPANRGGATVAPSGSGGSEILLCPKMIDASCRVRGHGAAFADNIAQQEALHDCELSRDSCKISQDNENQDNKTNCTNFSHNPLGCGFDSKLSNSPSCGGTYDCRSQKDYGGQPGLTLWTCYTDGFYDWTSYSCLPIQGPLPPPPQH